MNHLFRELAPISDGAWAEIDAEATRSLRNFLAARKLVDFTGPHGWEHSAANLGRIETLGTSPADGVAASARRVQPLVELRTAFTVTRDELAAIDRGSEAPDLRRVVDAARRAARAEDRAVFHGYQAGEIAGIVEQSPHEAIPIDRDYEEFPRSAARAVAVLRDAGVDGPYGIALGPRSYMGVIETTQKGGYPVLEQLRLIASGPLAWAPAVDGAIVLSLRTGDFELITGADFSIGYASHDGESIELYLEESMTFRAHTPEAAVALVHT
jgi:uncharacterized linocin/CFP29 family protein